MTLVEDKQIKEIMEAMTAQNKVLDQLRKDGEDRANAHFKVWQSLREDNKRINDNVTQLTDKMDDTIVKVDDTITKVDNLTIATKPIVNFGRNWEGFDNTTKLILKFVLGLAAVITAIGVIVLAAKRVLTGSFL